MNKRLWLIGIIVALGTSALVQAADQPKRKAAATGRQTCRSTATWSMSPGGTPATSSTSTCPPRRTAPCRSSCGFTAAAGPRAARKVARRSRFVAKGYAVASINYRFSQHAIFPAQIEDCKAAIRWLRANAKKYNLDASHIGVWGAFGGRSPRRPAGHDRRREGTGGQRAGTWTSPAGCSASWTGSDRPISPRWAAGRTSPTPRWRGSSAARSRTSRNSPPRRTPSPTSARTPLPSSSCTARRTSWCP